LAWNKKGPIAGRLIPQTVRGFIHSNTGMCLMQSQLEQTSLEMQRDMDLIRDILLKIEGDPMCDGHHFVTIDLPGVPMDKLNYHLMLLEQAGYVTGSETMITHSVSSLTWDGHEFLDNIKDPGIWAATKEKTKELGGVGLNVVAEIAVSLIKAHFHLP
jgi:Hypothetical protein (DUF2513)